jgi:very-short-patch-repair endonuclease
MVKKKYKSKKTNSFLLEKGKEFSNDLIENATQWEISFKKKLKQTKIPFIFQYPIVCSNSKLYILDFYLPKFKIAIELDGQWHYTPEMIKKDKIRTKALKKDGITVLRIANLIENQIKPEQIVELINSLIGKV